VRAVTAGLFDALTVMEAAALEVAVDEACDQVATTGNMLPHVRDAVYFEMADLRNELRQVFIRKFFEVEAPHG
jgi:hypothetical protein